jgi:hypothetical protein
LREIQILDQTVAGRSQHQIAAALGITQPAVSKILRRIEERLLTDLTYKIERQRARQTLQLGYLYGEALDAWHASKADAIRRRQRKAEGDGAGAGTVAEIVAENQHGDPRYLEVARKALGDLRTLWGVDAPERIETTAPYTTMSDAALMAELALQERLLHAAELVSTLEMPQASTTPDAGDTAGGDCDERG